eukprot:Lankesteria_metandrocarpae@DN3957_c0_g1_i2.p1
MDDDDLIDDEWSIATNEVLDYPKAEPHMTNWTPTENTADVAFLQGPPLYDNASDEADAEWVASNYRKDASKGTAAMLSCPGCFRPICFQCERDGQRAGSFKAKEVVGCRMEIVGGATPIAVKCNNCDATLGEFVDSTQEYKLVKVLPSEP